MQNFLKCPNLKMFHPRTRFNRFLRYLPKRNFIGVEHKCWNCNHIRCLVHPMSHHALWQIRREYRAVCNLLLRSGLGEPPKTIWPLGSKSLSTSSTYYDVQKPNDKSPKDTSEPGKGPDKNKDEEKMKALLMKLTIWTIFVYSAIIWLLYMFGTGNKNPENPRFVSWNEFVHHMLAKGEVEEIIIRPEIDMVTIVLHEGAVIKGRQVEFRTFHMMVPNVSELEEKIRQAERSLGIKPEYSVPVTYARGTTSIAHLASIVIVTAIFIALLSRARPKGKFTTDLFSHMTRAKFTLVEPFTGSGKGVYFSDVAGLQEAKVEVMEFVDYLKHPDRYRSLGAKVPKGALLLGPPGCGKTLLAKAVATEANVPFLSMNGSEFIEMIGGLGAARVRDLFREGKKRSPSIIYIDEIDAIGKKRSKSNVASDSESEQTLNQLLTEMDGMESNEEVIVLASTNRAEVLDKALLRPGRFDRHILIDLPTLTERKQIFEQHLKCISLDKKPTSYSMRLAHLTPGFSGADIANVCNESALHAARVKKKVVDVNDLLYAVDRTIAGIEKRDNNIAPSEKRVVAYHEAGHALVGWMLEHTDALLKVTIVPRTNKALGFAQFTPADQKLFSTEQLFERMCMSLGGRVAESLTFNKITTGAQNDLEKVTQMAYAQIQQFGMNRNIGPISFLKEQTDTKTKKPYSKLLAKLMDDEAMRLVGECYKKTELILRENHEKLKLLAEELLKRETLTYEDIEKLLGPPPFGKKKLVEPEDLDDLAPASESIENSESPPPPQNAPA